MPAAASHTARNELAVFLLAMCVVSGAFALIGTVSGHPTEPPAVVQAVPEWVRVGWYLLLISGGVTALSGVWHPHRKIGDWITGLLWERAGEIGLGAGAALYGVALVALDGPVAKMLGAWTLAFALACALRLRRIAKDLGRIRALLRASP